MTNIIAIDTSSEYCSVALWQNRAIQQKCILAERAHAQIILPMLDELLNENKMRLDDIEYLAFGAGPGSFTGVRIASALLQGLGLGLNLPIVPISTLAAIAQQAYREFGAKQCMSALDARMGEIYLGYYQYHDAGVMQLVQAEQVINPAQIIFPEAGQWFGVGPGFEAYDEIISQQATKFLVGMHKGCYPQAKYIAELAASSLKDNKYVSVDNLEPIYLRDPNYQTN